METKKQKAIREAWIVLIGNTSYTIRKDKIDENGYIQYETPNHLSVRHELCEKHPSRIDLEKWRPISLQGIETNNNWIKIESEADLPSEFGRYWIIDKDNGKMYQREFDKSTKSFFLEYSTHYQPIEKPKLPIY